MRFLFELGDHVKDSVTGFKGVVIGRAEHLTGCNTYGLQPPADDKGTYVESRWFDENRLVREPSIARFELPVQVNEIAESARRTGAGPNPSSTRSVTTTR